MIPKCLLKHIMTNYMELYEIKNLYKTAKEFHLLNKKEIGIMKLMNEQCGCGEYYADLCIQEALTNECQSCGETICKQCIQTKEYYFEYHTTKKNCNKCKKKLCRNCVTCCTICAEDERGTVNIHCHDCFFEINNANDYENCNKCGILICSKDDHKDEDENYCAICSVKQLEGLQYLRY